MIIIIFRIVIVTQWGRSQKKRTQMFALHTKLSQKNESKKGNQITAAPLPYKEKPNFRFEHTVANFSPSIT